MKLNRSIEAWDKCDAGAMSKMSEAAIKYAFADAKADIKRLAAIQAQLVEALKKLTERAMGFNVSGVYFGEMTEDRVLLDSACDALDAAGEQP